ncbi:uncharacterized protein LOC100679080 isoform X3 [Nasonia vitripennis]|nr:uncharacterized protein LOC100679080 isoform X3 [Nasonia vitripennis]XP_016836720.1 uncharacterized protein LOC100679080 isoform X3 [Nasonia vitripennis]
MCESVEVARILDVSGTLLNTTCRQNSALASAAVSIMAKIRMAEKVDLPKSTLLQPLDHYLVEKRSPSQAVNMASSLDSSPSSSYSSSPENRNLDDLIDSVQGIKIVKGDNIVNDDSQSFDEEYPSVEYKRVPLSTDDEDDEDEDDEGLIERGPVRPQLHPLNRARPYVDSSVHSWPSSGVNQPSENSTDYDTSAKAILTDREYREKIDFCLDKLSDSMSQARSASNSLSPVHSDFGGTSSSYSPPQQQQQWSPGGQRSNGSSCFVPSITVCDSETSLLEILSRGGFQPAQASRTPEYNSGASVASSSMACASDNWPDSPASSYNNCTTSASRPDSRSSSRAQSPGSNNGCNGISFLNVLGSPCMESPQVSPQNFRYLQRPSSSSSSSQSYCETPSPANYQNPLEQQLEEQLGNHMISQLPVYHTSFESSDTIVNDSRELQLQLVEELIRSDCEQNKEAQSCDMQVVPNCGTTTPGCSTNNYTTSPTTRDNNYPTSPSCSVNNYPTSPSCSVNNYPTSPSCSSKTFTLTSNLQITPPNPSPTYMENHDPHDDLTKTLLKFVGGEQTLGGQEKRWQADARSTSTTSGYSSSSSSSEPWKGCENSCLQTDQQQAKSNFLGSASTSPRPQQQTLYQQQQCVQMNSTLGSVENIQYPSTSVDARRNSWKGYTETSPMMSSSNGVGSSFSEFQIPETVTSYNCQRSKSSNHSVSRTHSGGCLVEARIAPWPSLNLPKTRASERLKENTTPEAVQRAMTKLLKTPMQELTHADTDGDTMLMCLVGNPMELDKKLAYLVPLVERLGTIDGALTMLNNRGEDALYVAAMNCRHKPYVVGYLAAAFLQKNIDIANRTYRNKVGENGDTLVHLLAAKGDSHGDVLAELLSLKTAEGKPVFDLSRRNYDGRTALHVAVETHVYHMALATTRLLLENGVDPMIKEGKCGDTALHMAVALTCDPALVATLTNHKQGAQSVAVENYTGNTPLHLAGAINERTTIERQAHICKLLKLAGAHSNQPNRQGKTVLALVAADRKEMIKRVFNGKC